ncbi:hypothetical protein U1769_09435 [Sphingomonas sp. ZT3P38]|uniref:hypothetical protein n=1 Tax=Parasphingomonas zepuensis TaxID=3096161 RepID=UPI002FC8222D
MPEQGDQPNANEGADPSSDIRKQNPGGTTTADLAGQPTEAGKRPRQSAPASGIGDVGTGDGYSGQEYDSKGQQAWRDEQEKHTVDPSGEVHGSGAGAGGGNDGEDYDSDSAAGSGTAPTGAGS